jgi:putative SOS response-associated peptidase YedK
VRELTLDCPEKWASGKPQAARGCVVGNPEVENSTPECLRVMGDVSWAPHWNIAPTQQVPVIRQDRKEPKRTFALLRWGLIPFWAKDASIGFKTINAMSETATEKPAFRDAMKLRRCLILAHGFYEWQELGTKVKRKRSTIPS